MDRPKTLALRRGVKLAPLKTVRGNDSSGECVGKSAMYFYSQKRPTSAPLRPEGCSTIAIPRKYQEEDLEAYLLDPSSALNNPDKVGKT